MTNDNSTDDTERDLEIRHSGKDDVNRVAYTKLRPPRCDGCCVEIWSTESQLYVRESGQNRCRECWMDRTGQDISEIDERYDDTGTDHD